MQSLKQIFKTIFAVGSLVALAACGAASGGQPSAVVNELDVSAFGTPDERWYGRLTSGSYLIINIFNPQSESAKAYIEVAANVEDIGAFLAETAGQSEKSINLKADNLSISEKELSFNFGTNSRYEASWNSYEKLGPAYYMQPTIRKCYSRCGKLRTDGANVPI